MYGFVGNDGVNWVDFLGLVDLCDCLELQINKTEVVYSGFLWNRFTHIYTPVADGGSIELGRIGDVTGSVNWTPDADDKDHECCKLKAEDPAPRLIIRGAFTPQGGDPRDIAFFHGQTYLGIYPFGTPQPNKNWWTGETDGPSKADHFYPPNHLKGKLDYPFSAKGKKCESRSVVVR